MANNEVRKYLDIDMDGIRKTNEDVFRMYRRVINGYYPKEQQEKLQKEYIGELNETVTRTQYRLLATEKAIINKITNSFMLDKIKLPNELREKYSSMKEYVEKRTKELEEIEKMLKLVNKSLFEEYFNRYTSISQNLEKALFLSPRKLKSNIARINYVQIKCSHSQVRISDKGRLIGSYFWKQNKREKEDAQRKHAENYPHDDLRPKKNSHISENPILGRTQKQEYIDKNNELKPNNGTIDTNNKWHNYRREIPKNQSNTFKPAPAVTIKADDEELEK